MQESLNFFQLKLPFFGLLKRVAFKKNLTDKTPKRKTNTKIKELELSLDSGVLEKIWSELIFQYFPDNKDLYEYQIRWSRRKQKRTLGSCNLNKKIVSIAKELSEERYLAILYPLIYHEMCHAALGIFKKERGKKRPWHGREFKALEKRHPGIPYLDAWIKNGGWRTAVRRARSLKMTVPS